MKKGYYTRQVRRYGMTLIEVMVVMFVMSTLTIVLISLISNFAFLKSTRDEATLLRDALNFCRTAAIKSNQAVYLEFNLDENSCEAFRFSRSDGKLSRDNILSKKELATGNALVAIAVGGGVRIEQGKLMVSFSPDGVGEELAIYMGDKPEISQTLIFSRYGQQSKIEAGEVKIELEDDEWEEDLERKIR